MFYTVICWVFGIAMLVLCSVITLEDMKTSYIRNRHIASGLKLCALALIAQLVVSLISTNAAWAGSHITAPVIRDFAFWASAGSGKSLTLAFYPVYLAHTLFAAALGVLIWKFNFWPAGDAKFFIVISAALPLVIPHSRLFPKALVAAFLMNIFLPAAAFFVAMLLISLALNTMRSEDMGAVRPALASVMEWFAKKAVEFQARPVLLLFLAVNYFVLFSLSQVLRLYAQDGLMKIVKSDFAIFLVLFLFWDKMYRLMMSRSTTLAALVIMGAYLVTGSMLWPDRISSDLFKGMRMVLQFGMLLMLFKGLVQSYFVSRETVRLPVEGLRPGMILASSSEQAIKADPVFYRDNFRDNYSDGLTAGQIESIRLWAKESSLEVCQTRPFAFWILAGAVLTVILQNDVIHWLGGVLSSAQKTGGGLL